LLSRRPNRRVHQERVVELRPVAHLLPFDRQQAGALDRVARDLMVQETIIADLRKRGFELLSVMEPDLLRTALPES
jgi:hypothetical protein